MSISGRIDDQDIRLWTVLLQVIDQFASMIRLKNFHLVSVLARMFAEQLINRRQRGLTVYLAFPLSQKIQIWTV
jgi:hypothetical protein